MKIRPIESKDLEKLVGLLKKVYPDGGSYYAEISKEAKESIEGDNLFKPYILVADEGGELVGMVGYSLSRINYRVHQVFSLMVEPYSQRRGIGTQLMNRVITEIKKQRREPNDDYLIMLTSKIPKYFERFGFKEIDRLNVNASRVMSLRV